MAVLLRHRASVQQLYENLILAPIVSVKQNLSTVTMIHYVPAALPSLDVEEEFGMLSSQCMVLEKESMARIWVVEKLCV